MELLQLKYFRESVRTKNFSHTAKKFLVPQSAVSQSIKRLEDELGVPLFNRMNNKIEPNECGKILYNQVNIALSSLDEGLNEIKFFNSDMRGSLSILTEVNRNFMMNCVSKFKKMYPYTDFTVYHQRPSDNCDLIFDIIVNEKPLKDKTYTGIPIVKEKVSVAVSKTHPLATETTVNVSRLKNEPLISMQANSSLHKILQDTFRPYKYKPNITIFCDDPNCIKKYVSLGLGVAFFPEFSWKPYLDDSIVLIPFEDISPEQVTYLHHKISKEYNNKIAYLFKEFVEMEAEKKHLYNS